ncbi:MAG: exodeoxyribonuclease V subunit beta [Desulfobacteraceae bacterium]|nr:exodeoxyribonuclease V subunit beta [Desulfobacteraceae bacterium]
MMTPLDPFNLDLEKITLIEASAGTGKTYTITTLVARLVAQGFAIESILVVTFTEAAAAELKLRIRGRLSQCLAQDWPWESDSPQKAKADELVQFFNDQPDPGLIRRRLAHAVSCFDQACIMTIHSFCFHTLKDNAFESGAYFNLELLTDSSLFFDQVCMDFFMTRINDMDPLMLKFLAQKGVTPENFKSVFRQVVTRLGIDIIPNIAEFKDVCDSYGKTTQKIYEILETQKEAIIALIQADKGVDKRSYTKKNLPKWLDLSHEVLATQGRDALFVMTEKGDPLFKFTRSRLADKTKDGLLPPVHEFFDLCEELLELFRVMETNIISLKLEFFTYFRCELEKMKLAQGACFFDDLINDLAAALEADGWELLRAVVTKKYKACLIDEFQDTDPAQYRIFSRLFTGPCSDNLDPVGSGLQKPDSKGKQMPFFMIGDPKQAIYGFRGGDIFAYLSACKESDQIFTLENNYRSAPLMVDSVNDLFCLDDNPFLFKQIEFTRVHTPKTAVNRLVEKGVLLPPLQFSFLKRDGFTLDRQGYIKKEEGLTAIPKLLANDILGVLNSDKRLLKGSGAAARPRKISPGDMAVLVRTNGQAEAVCQALADVNIPSFLSKTGSVFDSSQAIELYDILTAVYDPDHIGRLKAALASSVFGFAGERLADLESNESKLWKRQDQFRGFKDIWEQKGFVSMILVLFHCDDGVLRVSSGLSERGLTNFYHLIELVSQAVQQLHLSMFYLLKWYREQLFVSTRNEGADELRLESDKKAVAIVTIHKSKGLEYPIVFLPYLWAGGGKPREPILFHDPDKAFQLRLDLGASGLARGADCKLNQDLDRSRELMVFEERAEEKRLLYVALTRSSAMCRIFWAGLSSVDGSALGSLLHPGGCKKDGVMLDDLEKLCHLGKNRVTVDSICLTGEPLGTYRPKDCRQIDLSARSGKRLVQPVWHTSSFSALSISGTGYDPGKYEPGKYESDKSKPDKSKSLKPGSAQGGQFLPGSDTGASRQISLKEFPKGAGSGDFFHAIFEDLDFMDIGSMEGVVDANLAKFGIKDEALREMALAAVKEILSTKLVTQEGSRFAFKEVALAQRFTELEFLFDVKALDLNALGSLFMGEPDGKKYAKKLFQLGVKPFKGFIKGFIDLVICHQGKWYILDYKSNFLGTTYGDYDRSAMEEAMESHHYILQYHLYLVALHRYLGMRLKDYSYARDFGGVFYLFIRGMHPTSGDHGVFFHRPSNDFFHSLLAVL